MGSARSLLQEYAVKGALLCTAGATLFHIPVSHDVGAPVYAAYDNTDAATPESVLPENHTNRSVFTRDGHADAIMQKYAD